MGAMYRIICRKLLILIRLAIVLSLAGYSLSTATAAMHGPSSAGASAQISAVMQHGDGAQMSAHDHHQTVSADDDGSNLAKQECCKDFCIGLPSSYPRIPLPARSSRRSANSSTIGLRSANFSPSTALQVSEQDLPVLTG